MVDNVALIHRAVTRGLPGEHVELIVVSDGSIDSTAERLLAAREEADIRVIHYDRNLGKGYAVKTGALASHGQWVALIDSDLDLDPDAIATYLELARQERLDFAIGSKRHPESLVHYPRSRRIASRCYQELNRLLFRLDVRDTQVGLKVFSRGVVDDVLPLLLVKRFAFDLELLAVAAALGHGRVRELPVQLNYRFSGSELRSRAVVRALIDTLAIFYRLRILRTYQRKRHLLHGAPALLPEAQPVISLLGDHAWVTRLDYDRIEPAASPAEASGELVAILAPNARPAGNWLTAATPYFADREVAAVVAPEVTPPQATLPERAAAAVLESRLGGGSRRSRYFPGNVRVVPDGPAGSIVIRREDLRAALDSSVPPEELVSWLAEHRRRTVYTPDTSVAAAPPPLVRAHLAATLRHGRLRGERARRTRGASLSAATALSLVPLACAVSGIVLLAVGSGGTRVAGAVLIAASLAPLVVSALLAAVRFRSPAIGLLFLPSSIATQAAYVVGRRSHSARTSP